jgi:hypothetical protein
MIAQADHTRNFDPGEDMLLTELLHPEILAALACATN